MKIAVLSDVHDHLEYLTTALQRCQTADALIFCGDFCAPFTLRQIAEEFQKPVHAIFGNNDGDRFLLMKVAGDFEHVTLHGELARLELAGLRVAVNHYPEIAVEMAKTGSFDVVCYGHDHQLRVDKIGDCDLINPGEIMGRFGRSTFVMYDTATRSGQIVVVHENR